MNITTLTVNPAIDLTLEVDGLVIEDVNRVKAFQENAGGKGINVSRVLKAFGYKNLNTLTLLGSARGERFKKLFNRSGLKLTSIPLHSETRLNVTVFDRNARRTTKLNEPGPNVSEREKKLLIQTCLKFAAKSDYFVLAGSLTKGLRAGWYGEIIKQINRNGLKTLLDADGDTLKLALSSRPYLIKPNRYETERVLGISLNNERDLWHGAKRLQELGAQNVLMSLGANGVIFRGAKESWRGYSVPVKIKSTVGAGDSLMAGFLYKIANSKPVGEALRFAIACGTHTATTGATELCDRAGVMKLLPKIKVKQIKH